MGGLDRNRAERVLLLVTVLLLIVFSGFILILRVIPFLSIQREFIGSGSLVCWVPVYVLHDPPGNESTATLRSEGSGELTLSFRSNTPGVDVFGEYKGHLPFYYVQTSDSIRADLIVAIKLNQTWELWQCSTADKTWIEAVAANMAYGSGGGAFNTEGANQRDMWVEDLTGVSGDFRYHWGVAPGEVENVVLQRKSVGPTDMQMGFNVTVSNIALSVRIFLSIGGTGLTTEHVFNASSGELAFDMTSNGAIMHSAGHNYTCESLLTWFD